MYCYPGTMVGLYDPPEIEKEECMNGIPCNFGICSECTLGVNKEELNEAKADNVNIVSDNNCNGMW